METTTGRIFRPYFVMSSLCAVICLYHLWQDPYWKSRSFIDRIKLSRIGTAILGNMTFASLLLIYKGVLYIFFGPITIAETQKMWQRLVNYMVFNLLAVSAILDPRMDVVLKWGSWLLLMASMRLLCDLARNRFKVLITYTPNAAWWIHGKIVSLLILLLCADGLVFTWAMHIRDEFTEDQLFLVVSECFSLLVVAVGALIKYLIYYIDMKHFEGQWEHRGSYSYYTDLFSKSIILMVSLVYYATILHLHGVSLNIFFDCLIITRLAVILVSLRTKGIAYQNYRQLSNQIATMYKPVGPEEIELYNDSCAICRDPMTAALRLPCGHIFHTTCLRLWLEHNHNCPTCRYALISQSPAPVSPRPNQASRPRPNVAPPAQQSNQQAPYEPAIHRSPAAAPQILSENPAPILDLNDPSLHTHAPQTVNQMGSNQAQQIFNSSTGSQQRSTNPSTRTASPTARRPTTPQRHRQITNSSEALSRHEEMVGNHPSSQSVWSFSSPSWLAWLPSLSVEVVRGQDPGIGHLDQKDLAVHRENLEQIRLLFPEIPESVALADLMVTNNLQETINNIIENRLSWAPAHQSPNVASSSAASSSAPSYAAPTVPYSQTRTQASTHTTPQAPIAQRSTSPTVSSSSASPARIVPSAVASVASSSSPARTRLVQSSPSAPSKTRAQSPATYQERKLAMIEACRAAYLKKMELRGVTN